MESLRYLNNFNLDNKRLVLLQQVLSMNSLTCIGEKKYTPEMIGRAFLYFAISRSLPSTGRF